MAYKATDAEIKVCLKDMRRYAYYRYGGHREIDDFLGVGAVAVAGAVLSYKPGGSLLLRAWSYQLVVWSLNTHFREHYDIAAKSFVRPDWARGAGKIWGVPFSAFESQKGIDGAIDTTEGFSEHSQRVVQELVSGLPELEQKVLFGRYYEGKTVGQLGLELGYSKQWVSMVISSGLESLRKGLDQYNADMSKYMPDCQIR